MYDQEDRLDDRDDLVELCWTADAQFLVDAAQLLTASSIPFSTQGAETLNPEMRARAAEAEPMAAHLFVPDNQLSQARSLLDAAGMDPAAAGLPEPDDLPVVRVDHKTRPAPKSLVGRVAWRTFRALDYVFTLLLKMLAYFIAFLASLVGLG